MAAITLFIIGAAVSVRTMLYGIWTLRQKNFTGGIFVILLAGCTLTLAARYYFTS